jgi:aspartate racemase
MPVVGLIGGTAPESTADYYRGIIAQYRARSGNNEYPRILINSINLTTLVQLVTTNRLDELTNYLLGELKHLSRAGADFGLLAANTPHIVFDRLSSASPLPLLSIVDAAAAAAHAKGFQTVALLGTRFTMEAGFYPPPFARLGIRVVLPSKMERDYIHEKYMGELIQGQFHPETRASFLALIQALLARESIDAVVLGGTELPLLLRETPEIPCPTLDTAAIHVESVVTRLLALEGGAEDLPGSSLHL